MTNLRNHFRLHRQLRQLACPSPSDKPLYRHCIAIARAHGMSRVEALEFAAATRNLYL